MNRITKIGLAGVGPFKKGTVLPIVNGVTVLYGKNLRNGSGNAVGKSLLASSVSEIFYDEPIVGLRQDKSKAGRKFVAFTRGKNEVTVESNHSHGEKITVKINGEDRSARLKKNTKELLHKLWPITQEEYMTYGYVDASVPHPLVRGSGTARKAFFNEFFRLNQMDLEKKVFVKRSAKLRETRSAHTELARTFAEIKGDMLTKEQRVSLQSKLEKIQSQIDKMATLEEQYQKWQNVNTFKEFFKEMLAKVDTTDDAETRLKAARIELRKAEANESAWEEYREYRRDLERYKNKCASLDMEQSIEDLKKDHDKLTKALYEFDRLSEVEHPGKEPKKVAAPKTDLREVEANIRRLEHALQHARKFKTGVCGECGQPVKKMDPKKLREELEAAESEREHHEEYKAFVASKEAYDAKSAEYERVKDRIAELTEQLPYLKTQSTLFQKRSALAKPQKVEKPEGTADVSTLREQVKLLEFIVQNKENIEAAMSPSSKVDFDPDKLRKAREEVQELQRKLDLHNTVKTRASKIRERLIEMEDELKEQQILDLILEAYNDKAMKKMAIEAICRHLMEVINRYSALVFDNYQFEFVWGTQIRILVHRPIGTTDVRKLSGAESMLFTLILILALLKFVPKSRRLSLLILDEPTASFSEYTAEAFNKLLPRITQVIPSVLIITPKSSVRVPNATELTVVRDTTGAHLVKGHPDAL